MSHRPHTLSHFKKQLPRASGADSPRREVEMTYILVLAKAAFSTGAQAIINFILQSTKFLFTFLKLQKGFLCESYH